MNAKQTYIDIFRDIFNIDERDLTDKFIFRDIEKWDSLTHLTLITELEDAFDVLFETDDILSFGSYSNGIKILQKYGVKFED